MSEPLPIDAVLPALLQAQESGAAAVLVAPTGAGKTTRVPPALLASRGIAGRIVMLEPRRVAARAAARRMAEERGWTLGSEVGYQVRFDRRFTHATRILVVTEGILVRMLQDDPFLEGVGAVIFDEFHERSIHTDLALAMARRVQADARPDLKLLVMSATLDPAPVAAYLGGAPVIESTGRLFPVDIVHLDEADPRPSPVAAAAGVRRAFSACGGGVLCFLAGVAEIRRTSEELDVWARSEGIDVLPLYGDLPPEQQDLALRPGPRPRVVLATNVAETSVTVVGVRAVVDTGLARVLRHDPALGLDRLEIGRISRASADQRAGRAGREGPGLCLRLWTAAEQRGLREREEPEIRRIDLAGPALELLCWGETDLEGFGWFEAPAPAALQRARELLRLLGALGEHHVTALGRQMGALPVHPRLARLLVEGHRLGHPEEAARIAALLSERDPFAREPKRPGRTRSDVLDRLDALESLDRGAARFVLRSAHELAERVERELGREARARSRSRPDGTDSGRDEALMRALLAAFPDRLARRREPGGRRAVLVGGRGVQLADDSGVLDPELFLCIDLDAGRRGERAEALVRLASGVEPGWLPSERLSTTTELELDGDTGRVVARQRTRYANLVIAEKEVPPEPARAAAVLAEAAARDLEGALPLHEPAVERWLSRVRCLAEWMPELGLPRFTDEELRGLLPDLCSGRRSLDDLRRAPLLPLLEGKLTHRQRQALEREAPERLQVPSGSRIALVYEAGKPPVLPVKIQELFGLADTPRVAAGRVEVVLHLLAPNGRPQQVTKDLRSFWDTTYQQVRKELRGRYPKHAWPEDPWNAPAQRRPQRRRS
jgi:ATP-dependent RNA helicase HrpB